MAQAPKITITMHIKIKGMSNLLPNDFDRTKQVQKVKEWTFNQLKKKDSSIVLEKDELQLYYNDIQLDDSKAIEDYAPQNGKISIIAKKKQKQKNMQKSSKSGANGLSLNFPFEAKYEYP